MKTTGPASVPELVVVDALADGDDGAGVRICAAGDLGFAGALHGRLEREAPGDITAGPLAEIAPFLHSANAAFVNLETPIVAGSTPADLFAAPSAAADAVTEAGFTVVNLANNHVLDHGAGALGATRQALERGGVAALGAGANAVAARRLVVQELGVRIGWLAAARTHQRQEAEPQAAQPHSPGDVFWEYSFDEMRAAVIAARAAVDVLFVSLHMGYLFVDVPHPDQRRDALALVDAGADVVLMCHAHVLQGIEIRDGARADGSRPGVVCYNLGNLLFDWRHGAVAVERSVAARMEEEQRTGAIFVFDVDRRGVRRLTLLPVRVDDDWNLRWAPGAEGRHVLERVGERSDWDTARIARRFHTQMAERVTVLAARSTWRELRQGGVTAFFSLLRRLRPHHVRMVVGWLVLTLHRWWRASRETP